MQKSLLFLFFLGAVLTARAEWVVVQHGGTATTVSHADVRRITFEGGNMVTLMADGTVVQRSKIVDGTATLSLAGLPKGVYVVKTPSGTFKIMKQ